MLFFYGTSSAAVSAHARSLRSSSRPSSLMRPLANAAAQRSPHPSLGPQAPLPRFQAVTTVLLHGP